MNTQCDDEIPFCNSTARRKTLGEIMDLTNVSSSNNTRSSLHDQGLLR